MKKAILTIGLFSLVLVLTSFTTPETATKLKNNTAIELNGSVAIGGNKKVDLNGSVAIGGNKKVDLNGSVAIGGNKKVD